MAKRIRDTSGSYTSRPAKDGKIVRSSFGSDGYAPERREELRRLVRSRESLLKELEKH